LGSSYCGKAHFGAVEGHVHWHKSGSRTYAVAHTGAVEGQPQVHVFVLRTYVAAQLIVVGHPQLHAEKLST
jgi:hypothetical protein